MNEIRDFIPVSWLKDQLWPVRIVVTSSRGRRGSPLDPHLEDRQDPLPVVRRLPRGEAQLKIGLAGFGDKALEQDRVREPVEDAPHVLTLHPTLAPRKVSD